MATKVLVNAMQIAEMAGVKGARSYTSNKLAIDPLFPNPVIVQAGKSFWFKHEIQAYLDAEATKPKAKNGRTLSPRKAAEYTQKPNLDLSLAKMMISPKRRVAP